MWSVGTWSVTLEKAAIHSPRYGHEAWRMPHQEAMERTVKKKIGIISAICAFCLLWMGGIFALSDMNSDSSYDLGAGLMGIFIEDTLTVTNKAGITNSKPTESNIAKMTRLVNGPVRKVMHASVYFILAIIVMIICSVAFDRKHYALTCLIAFLVAVIFACTDELHQTMVPGRTGRFLDVAIDSTGAIIGILFYSSYRLAYFLGMRRQEQLTTKEKNNAKNEQ